MMRKIFALLIFLCLLAPLLSLKVPALQGRINDYANILSPREEQSLDNYLAGQETKTTSQVVLLTIPSLENENLEEYSIRVAQTWRLGTDKYDNGVLLLVAMAEKKIRIEVGYGLEAILTDAKSGYIIRNYIVPEFKQGNYPQGIANGLTAICGLISAEFEISDEELARSNRLEKEGSRIQIPFGLLIFLFMIIFGGLGRRSRGGLLPLLLLGSMLGGGRSGRSGGFGGFSGGGGSFGGGGASGGW